MTDRERAIAALRRAGFAQLDDDCLDWEREPSVPSDLLDGVRLRDDGVAEVHLSVPIGLVPALLSPLARLRHQMGVGGEQPAETRITVTIDVQTWQGYHDRRVIEVEPGIGWPERMAPEVLKAALEMEERHLNGPVKQNGGEGR